MSVEVLTPQQELDRVIASGNICLHTVRFMQRLRQKLRRDRGGVDICAGQVERRAGHDIQSGKLILIRWTAIRRIHIVDQTFIQGPGIYFAFPVINDWIAETVHFSLLVGHAGGKPCVSRCGQIFCGGICHQYIHSYLQALRRDQAIAVFRGGDIGVIYQYISFFDRKCGECKGSSSDCCQEGYTFHMRFL